MHKNSFNQIMKRYYEDKRLGIKNEDAPTNSVGTGALVALPPTHEPGIDPKKKKKKDKQFIQMDGRTKEARKFIEKILSSRQKREQKKLSVQERTLTPSEKEKLKDLEKKVPKKDFIDRYGDEGESVYYATLTKMAKDEGFASDAQRRAAFARGYKAKGKKNKKEETSMIKEANVDIIKNIVKTKGNKDIKLKDGKLKIDLFTASAITAALDKVKPETKKKMEQILNTGNRGQVMKFLNVIFK